MPSRRYRVGVIGIGFGQAAHVPAFRSDPRCEVTAICGSTLDRAHAVARRLGIPRAYGDWRALILSEIDIVSIAVPPWLQPEIVEYAADHGKHLFCEKPLALDTSGAIQAVEAVRRAGVTNVIDFWFHRMPTWARARELVAAGAIGAPLHGVLSWAVETRDGDYGRASWKRSAAAGGGVLNGFVSHAFHYLEWLLGPICGLLVAMTPSAEEPRAVHGLVRTSTATVTIAIATDARSGSGHRLELYGEEGSLRLENPSRDHAGVFRLSAACRGDREQREILREEAVGSGDARVGPVSSLARELVDAVADHRSAVPALDTGVRVQALLDAAQASHARASWISM